MHSSLKATIKCRSQRGDFRRKVSVVERCSSCLFERGVRPGVVFVLESGPF